jgi:hypothetical protein
MIDAATLREHRAISSSSSAQPVAEATSPSQKAFDDGLVASATS